MEFHRCHIFTKRNVDDIFIVCTCDMKSNGIRRLITAGYSANFGPIIRFREESGA